MRSEIEIRDKLGELIETLISPPNCYDDYCNDLIKSYLTALLWTLEESDQMTDDIALLSKKIEQQTLRGR